MINCITKSKKAAVTSSIADFWAYVAFVFVVLIFYGFFTFQSRGIENNKISPTQAKISNNLQLINYLKTPYTIDGSTMTMADMIMIYHNEKDSVKKSHYYEEILKKTKEILNPFEYCTVPEGISDKVIVGYAVYILDEESYKDPIKLNSNYGGTSVRVDQKFRSDHFFDGLIEEQTLGIIPNLIPGNVIPIGFFVSSVNTVGRDTKNAKNCE